MSRSMGMSDGLCLCGVGMDENEEEVECPEVWVCLTASVYVEFVWVRLRRK